jgi:hypothetical protein
LISGPLVLGVRPNLKVDCVALFLENTLSLNKMVEKSKIENCSGNGDRSSIIFVTDQI